MPSFFILLYHSNSIVQIRSFFILFHFTVAYITNLLFSGLSYAHIQRQDQWTLSFIKEKIIIMTRAEDVNTQVHGFSMKI